MTDTPATYPPAKPDLISPASTRRAAFTLVELLVVIGIIVVLIGILLPVIGKVRIQARVADTRNWINELGSAIERYQQDFRAYPGPFRNDDIYRVQVTGAFTGGAASAGTSFTQINNLGSTTNGYDTTAFDPKRITMEENLVLGLLGGIRPNTVATPGPQLDYDPTAVGSGPVTLNTVGLIKRFPAYLDAKQLSWQSTATGITGHFFDAAAAADDTIVPCFVDRFNDPMPVLYMRAKVGAAPASSAVAAGTFSDAYNPVVTDDLTEISAPLVGGSTYAVRAGQFDTSQIVPYVGSFTGSWPTLTSAAAPAGSCIGVGKSAKSSLYTTPPSGGEYHGLAMKTWSGPPAAPTMTSQYPYDAYPYFTGSAGVARQRDGYILISAGADRVYGTADDICNFGAVGE